MKTDPRDDVPGFMYLLHFLKPLGDPTRPHMSAQHYLGWTSNVDARFHRHENGDGAAIMKAVANRKIGVVIVWIRPGTRNDERRLKNAGHFKERLCTYCKTAELNKDIDSALHTVPS
jgi:predicted GIY-YIG superfamily endonuclease